ncbi:MAG: plasmid pRiA4b ORF-3 family protein [Clostridiales bacterium]
MKVYKIKINLVDINPPIWRRLVIPSNITFYKLHKIIQAVFDWQDYHLFEFNIYNINLGLPDESGFGENPDKNAKREKIDSYFKKGVKFIYTYDFGDNWEHKISVEDILEGEEDKKYPVCIKGKRQRPPEDVGGTFGYEDFLNIISDPTNDECQEMLEWAEKDTGGRKFDPEYFYLPEINKRLARIR